MEHRFGMSRKLPPATCPDCNSKLGPIEYGRKYDKNYRIISPVTDGFAIWRECSCGCYIVWSYPNVWKRHHRMPILNMKHQQDIIQIAR